jgi:hypothetical protein
MGIAATVMLSIMTLMKYQSKMDMFYNSAQKADDLVSRLDFSTQYVFTSSKTLEELDQLAFDIGKKITEIRSCAPPIPMQLEIQARKTINLGLGMPPWQGELPFKQDPCPIAPQVVAPIDNFPPPSVIEPAAPFSTPQRGIQKDGYEDPRGSDGGCGGDGSVEQMQDVSVLAKVRPLPACTDDSVEAPAGVAGGGHGAATPPQATPDKVANRPQSWDTSSSHRSSSSSSERGGDWTL